MSAMTGRNFTCPCCGYLTFTEWPGSYDVCPICHWEDDPVQLLDPWYGGGANRPSLREAQIAYSLNGAMELRFRRNVRAPTLEDRRDAQWRAVEESDRGKARTPATLSDAEYKNLGAWYYWRRPMS
jgi:hypothetical protein